MESFFVSTFVVGFFGTVLCYLATVIAIRMFVPDAGWQDAGSLDSCVWKKQIPLWIRRLYLVCVCFFALGIVSGVPLAFMGGQFIAILFAIGVMGALIYKLYRLWFDHYGEF